MSSAQRKKKTPAKGRAAKSPRPSAAGTKGRGAAAAEGIRPAAAGTVGPARRYLKSRPVCKVTFRLPADAAAGAARVFLVGDFNAWEPGSAVMRRLRDGSFSVTVDLETGSEYHFRYLVDGCRWENDWGADRYEPNIFGSDDSVIAV